MAQGTAFWTAQTQFLDEEFDAPDAVADRELCRAIVAGKMGLHPDAWGAHDPLTTPPPHHREPFVPPVGYPADRADIWNEHKPRPKPKPKPRFEGMPPTFAWTRPSGSIEPPKDGALQLTCDVCARVRFGVVNYYGDRSVKVAEIRALGHIEGWTCITGIDRCPQCSQAAAPEPVGNGAGGDQGDKQHA